MHNEFIEVITTKFIYLQNYLEFYENFIFSNFIYFLCIFRHFNLFLDILIYFSTFDLFFDILFIF